VNGDCSMANSLVAKRKILMGTTNNHLSLINNHLAFGTSTTVERALQIAHFMQNKPNFPDTQMNVTKVLTKDYENETLGKRGKNKANSNPIQTQSNPIKANIMPKQTQSNSILCRKASWEKIRAICEGPRLAGIQSRG